MYKLLFLVEKYVWRSGKISSMHKMWNTERWFILGSLTISFARGWKIFASMLLILLYTMHMYCIIDLHYKFSYDIIFRFGEWTRAGCLTELPVGDWWKQSVIIVNCTCTTLSTHSVLVDLVAQQVSFSKYRSPWTSSSSILTNISCMPYYLLQYVREKTEVEEVSTWAGLVVSLWFLAVALLCVSLASTKSNYSSIYYNLILCLFLAQTLYLIALKAGTPLLMHNVRQKFLI